MINTRSVSIHLDYSDNWEQATNTYVRGQAFLDDDHLSTTDITAEILDCHNLDGVVDLLSNLNGFYSIIHQAGDKLLLAVDHIATSPLYYSVTGRTLYVSDSSNWVHTQTSGEYDPYAVTECLHLSYVTGDQTMSSTVHRLPAGEHIIFDIENGPEIVRRDEHYRLKLGSGTRAPDFDTIDEVMLSAFERFIETIRDRTVLLSLSGGYDSRLIALMLARLGYEDVITYTHDFSTGDANDVPVAREVADSLGFNHVTVTPTHEDFREFYTSDRWGEFCTSVDHLSNIPSVHEIVVLEMLLEHDSVPENAIDVRGHLPIPHGGPAFPDEFRERFVYTREEFCADLWASHYTHYPVVSGDKPFQEYLFGRALDALPMPLYTSSTAEAIPDVADAISAWYTRERTSKQLVLATECDFLELDCWFPLWDHEILGLLEDIQVNQLLNKRVQKEYVTELSQRILGDDHVPFHRLDETPSTATGRLQAMVWDVVREIVSTLPDSMESKSRTVYDARTGEDETAYQSQPWYGLLTEEKFNALNLQSNRPLPYYLIVLYQEDIVELPQRTELDFALSSST